MRDDQADIRALQQLYIDTLNEELPPDLKALLARLDERTAKDDNSQQ